MLHVSETWPLTKPDLQRLWHTNRAMIIHMCDTNSECGATVRSKKLLAQLEID